MTREMLLEKIYTGNNKKSDTINRMIKSSLPLVMYGIGGYAKGLLTFLNERQIKLSATCLDNEFINPTKAVWCNIPVLALESLYLNYDSFNVLIGFADFKLAKNKLKNIKGCNEVFFLDSTLSVDFFNYDFISKNADNYLTTYNLLNDQLSKDTFIAYINAKISGFPDELYELVRPDQYFPEDIIRLGKDEIFIDGGAYDGDTVLKFVNKTKGHYRNIYAFEPDKVSYEKLRIQIDKSNLQNTMCFQKGLWKENAVLKFNMDKDIAARSSISLAGEILIEVEAIDNIVENNKATFIKMDIEGAELLALQGAENTIKNSLPKLAICVYHKPEDLITIPQFLKNIVQDYRFYLRHHLQITHELVLYAVPK